MAAIGGMLAASYTGKVVAGPGGGNVLLYAVGAAVIGGTSLFGGRGRAIDAVHRWPGDRDHPQRHGPAQPGGLHQLPGHRGVLLLAASVDAISRRRRSAAGV